MQKLLKVTSVRLDSDTDREVADVAKVAGVLSADVVRLCVKYGLPIVRAGFQQMDELSTSMITKPKGKGKELATK